MDKNTVVIYKEPKKNSEYLKMKNSNESFKEKLGGEIEKLDFEDFCIIYKKDSDNLLPNVYVKPKVESNKYNYNYNKNNNIYRSKMNNSKRAFPFSTHNHVFYISK